MSTALIVPAAGGGRRLGANRPKALMDLDGVPMVRRTLGRFSGIPDLIETVVVVPEGWLENFGSALANLEFHLGDVRIIPGGDTRQVSVRFGLEALASRPDLICVHDAARPLVSRQTVSDVIARARRTGAAVAASKAVDSVRESLGEGRTRSLDRASLWLVQTPQVFHAELLLRAHQSAKATQLEATDDAALVERAGAAVDVVESSGPNFKITSPEDLELARLLLGRSDRERR